MSTDKDAVRLAFHIIQHNFGPLVGKVARPLLHRGLLTLPQIHKLSLLPPSAGALIQGSLLLLAQHNLLWLTPASLPGAADGYEINTRAVFDLERVGRAVEGARAKWGDEAAEVVELVAGKGKACLGDVLAGLSGAGGGKVEMREVTEEVEEEVSDDEDEGSASGSSTGNSDGDSDSGSSSGSESSDDDASDASSRSSGSDRRRRSRSSKRSKSSASSSKKASSSSGRKPPPRRTTAARSKRAMVPSDNDHDDSDGDVVVKAEKKGTDDDESDDAYASDASDSRKRKRATAGGKSSSSKRAKKDSGKAKKSKKSSSASKKKRSKDKGKDKKGKDGKSSRSGGRRKKTVKRLVTRTVAVGGQGMDKKRANSIEKTLLALLSSSYILPAHPELQTSPNHLRSSLRKEELAKLRGVIAPKDRNEAFAKANVRIGELRDEWSDWRRGLLPKKNAKAKKTTKSALDRADGEPDAINPAAYFYINFDKFALLMRDELVVKAASDRLNPEAGQVVLSLLAINADGPSASLSQTQSPPVTVHQIVHRLPPNLKLHKGIFDPSDVLTASSSPAELVACFCALLAAEDNPTASGARTQILAKVKGARDSSASYAVEFEGVCRRLKGRVLDSVVRERWGDDAGRVMAVVLKNGKMDEKHISKVAMLAPKDVRVITAALSASSLLELQEVPRSADRAPSRTFYLWHVDLARAYAAMISHLYKTMANLIQRKAAELEKKRGLVERRNRVDVRESGGELLGELDKKEGKELDDKLLKLTLAEMRTDMNVFILRDLPGGPVGSTQMDVFDKA